MSCERKSEEHSKEPRSTTPKKKRRSKSFLPKIFSRFKKSPKKNSVTPSDHKINCCKKDFDGKPPTIEICNAFSDSASIKSITNSIRSFISGSIISEDWNPANGLQYAPKGNGLSPSLKSPSIGRLHSPRSNGRSHSLGSLGLPVPPPGERANSNISIFTGAEPTQESIMSGAYMPGFAVNRFKQIFDLYDKNGDNVINVDELSGILEILGYSPTFDEVRKILERFDQDNSGTIDFDEYLTLIQHWIEQDEEQIYEAFKVFDRDGDGFVSAQELKRALTQYGEQFTEEEANEFFNMMDTDGDGL